MIELGKYMVADTPTPSVSGKTNVWVIRKPAMGRLGIVSWYGPWRCYVFCPDDSTLFNAECMQELSDFTHCVTAAHKAAQSAARGEGT